MHFHGLTVVSKVISETIDKGRTNEVFKDDILNCSASFVGFDHHHLVGRPGVDISVYDITDISV